MTPAQNRPEPGPLTITDGTDALFRGDSCDPELIRGLEERLVNLWPAVATLLIDGWAVRMAHGYSSRANSASAVVTGASLSRIALRHVEGIFRTEGLVPCVRVTPVAARGTTEMLLSEGYSVKERTWVMHAPALVPSAGTADGVIRIERTPSMAWLSGVSALQEASKSNPDHLRAIVGHIRTVAGFGTLFKDGQAIGFGMTAIDRDVAELGSIILSPDCRGQGLGRQIVEALLDFASQNGASSAFLQVNDENAPARRLYAKLGFREICGYTTLIHPH